MNTIFKTDFKFPRQISKYEGKVRDVYSLEDDILVIVASDRISAFDIIMPKPIPFKGQILNQISVDMLKSTEDIIQNWLISSPDPNVSVGVLCQPFKVEMVIRGYLSGHSYRIYNSGQRNLCGNILPENMNENDKFKSPIITPATKAEKGLHDEDISPKSIIEQNIINKDDYEYLHEISLELFKRGTEFASNNGLILVDTKYEFGYDSNGVITLIDEIHTPDSSRYFYKDSYEDLQIKGEKQKQLSKEFFREWLMQNGFQGKSNQVIPEMTEDVVEMVSGRYIELYEKLIGKKFSINSSDNIVDRINKNLKEFIV